MKLSIVTTLYDSAPYIAEFYARIVRTVRKITQDYELILVNDGSPESIPFLVEIGERLPWYSRNSFLHGF